MGIIRDSFVIFKNWAEAINALPEDYQLETYKALVSYGLNGDIPEGLSPVAHAMLISFSAGMENNILRYNASVENGKKGGRPKKEITQDNLDVNLEEIEKPNETQQNLEKPSNNLEKPNETQPNLDEPNPYLNVNVNVNDNNIYKKEINKERKNTILTDSELNSLIEDNFKDKDVCQKFKDYVEMRRAMGKNKAIRTKSTFDSCISKLRKYAWNKTEAIEVLDHSIANCYQGLFDIFGHCKAQPKDREAIPYAN